MSRNSKIRSFFLPAITTAFIARVIIVALVAYLFFSQLCIPFRIEGYSMEPTYKHGDFTFCWRLHYLFSEPERGDIVLIRFAGKRVMLMKRIVAIEGQRVEFRGGRLWVDSQPIDEPYVRIPGNWNLEPRLVKHDNVYVVGDNRGVPMEQHVFGQTSVNRIIGVPVW